jgi:hypothetical protein
MASIRNLPGNVPALGCGSQGRKSVSVFKRIAAAVLLAVVAYIYIVAVINCGLFLWNSIQGWLFTYDNGHTYVAFWKMPLVALLAVATVSPLGVGALSLALGFANGIWDTFISFVIALPILVQASRLWNSDARQNGQQRKQPQEHDENEEPLYALPSLPDEKPQQAPSSVGLRDQKQSVLDRAVEILKAEAQDGCRDRVVVGGLAGFMARFAERIAEDITGDEQHSSTLRAGTALLSSFLRDYSNLDPRTRAARLQRSRELLACAISAWHSGTSPTFDDAWKSVAETVSPEELITAVAVGLAPVEPRPYTEVSGTGS